MAELALRKPLSDWLGLDEIRRGIVEGVAMVVFATIPAGFVLGLVSAPSPELFGDLADVGIVLVLAYVLEAVWLVPRFSGENDYENRLGGITGLGMAGMIGVAVAIGLAAHRAAGHENALDAFGAAWILVSLSCLAGVVIAQPLLVHDWEFAQKPKKKR